MATSFNHCVLRAWRLDSGMTLEEVCFRAGVSYPYLRSLEDRGGNPSAAVLARVAAVYGRPIEELFNPGHHAADACARQREAADVEAGAR